MSPRMALSELNPYAATFGMSTGMAVASSEVSSQALSSTAKCELEGCHRGVDTYR